MGLQCDTLVQRTVAVALVSQLPVSSSVAVAPVKCLSFQPYRRRWTFSTMVLSSGWVPLVLGVTLLGGFGCIWSLREQKLHTGQS